MGKNEKKSLVSALVTIFIVLMLVISGPASAVQVSINTDDLNNRPVGETGSFFINVTIGANEFIPIADISVEGLPEIPGSPGGMLVFNVGDFNNAGDFIIIGNYTISLVEQIGLVRDFGYGYGYVDNVATPPFFGYGYGYQFFGYGYGYGVRDGNAFTRLNYKVTVDTTGALPGTYDVVAKLNTGQDVAFRGVSSFTLLPALGSISGFKINDENANREQDAGEPGIPGVEIRLRGIGVETAGIAVETETDVNGFFIFDNLPAGRYILIERRPEGFISLDPVKTIAINQSENSVNNNFTNIPIAGLLE